MPASDEIKIRNMTRDELDLAVEWAAKEGWNPGLNDAQVFWDTDPEGFYTLEVDGRMVGSESAISYNGKFGFIGFYIVLPEFRDEGLGVGFAQQVREKLKQRLDSGVAIGIDGVFNMQDRYARNGYLFSHRDLRVESVAEKHDFSANIKVVKEADFGSIFTFDHECFGFERKLFLNGWLKMPQSRALMYKDGLGVKGYGVIRKCRLGYKIGPLFAENYVVADELFKALTTEVTGEKVYLDVPEINKKGMKLAQNYKMKECFGCARMYIGAAPKLPYEKIFGVTTFELG